MYLRADVLDCHDINFICCYEIMYLSQLLSGSPFIIQEGPVAVPGTSSDTKPLSVSFCCVLQLIPVLFAWSWTWVPSLGFNLQLIISDSMMYDVSGQVYCY